MSNLFRACNLSHWTLCCRLKKSNLRILGLDESKSYTVQEVKQAYTKMAKIHHPDVSKHKDAKQQFQAVLNAYNELVQEINNPEKFHHGETEKAWREQGPTAQSSPGRPYTSRQEEYYQQGRRSYYQQYDFYQQYNYGQQRQNAQGRSQRTRKMSPEEAYYYQQQQDFRRAWEEHEQQFQQRANDRIGLYFAMFSTLFGIYVILSILGWMHRTFDEINRHQSRLAREELQSESLQQFMARRQRALRGLRELSEKECIQIGTGGMIELERRRIARMPDRFAETLFYTHYKKMQGNY